ncbi:hypothetical protein AGMMS50276_01570 [Synergistales bacterium]|nr:hypothetical protein AGMMS50276_01570 [Synergistales bacterium]
MRIEPKIEPVGQERVEPRRAELAATRAWGRGDAWRLGRDWGRELEFGQSSELL